MDKLKDQYFKRIIKAKYDDQYKIPSFEQFYEDLNTELTRQNLQKWYNETFDEPYQNTKFLKQPKEWLPIYSKTIGYFQIDLMFLPKYEKETTTKAREPNFYTRNDEIIFCAIEVNSRWGFTRRLNDRKAQDTKAAFEQLIEEFKTKTTFDIHYVQTDQGVEFNNRLWKEYCQTKNIILYFTDTNDKHINGKVERFNRTIKEKLLRRCIAQYQMNRLQEGNPLITPNQLDRLLSSTTDEYNGNKHSSIQMSPNKFQEKFQENYQQEYMIQKLKSSRLLKTIKALEVGDEVRIAFFSRDMTFTKSQKMKYSDEIYTIANVTKNKMYILNDKKGLVVVNPMTNQPKRFKYYGVKLVKDHNTKLMIAEDDEASNFVQVAKYDLDDEDYNNNNNNNINDNNDNNNNDNIQEEKKEEPPIATRTRSALQRDTEEEKKKNVELIIQNNNEINE